MIPARITDREPIVLPEADGFLQRERVQAYLEAYRPVILAHAAGRISDREALDLLGSIAAADEAVQKLNAPGKQEHLFEEAQK